MNKLLFYHNRSTYQLLSGCKLFVISSAIFTVSIRFVAPVKQKLHVEKVENHEVTPLTKLPRLTLVALKPATGVHEVIKVGCREEDFAHRTCYSLDYALGNLTENAVLSIISDVMLSSVFVLKDFANITLIGQNSPIVRCSDGGGLHFISCHNCTIENLHWVECGSQSVSKSARNSVIQFHKSSNIKIRNCSFKNSLGQGIVLFEVMGAVTIDHCKFTSNQYKGDGTAIYATLNETNHSDISYTFMISNCNFSHNEGASSVVYVSSKSLGYLSLRNSTFHKNIGSPIYISNAGLVIDGTVVFEENLAQNGGGICMDDHSYVQFCGNSTVTFKNNNAEFGGAIYMSYYSNILLHQSSTVLFYTNKASQGGAVYSSYYCHISSEGEPLLVIQQYYMAVL